MPHTVNGNSSTVHPPSLANRRLIRYRGNPADNALSNAPPDSDLAKWRSLDTELAFRLGLLLLALPRPQQPSDFTEVRIVEMETTLLTRMHRLPLETACPWVVPSAREVARDIAAEGASGASYMGDCFSKYLLSYLL